MWVKILEENLKWLDNWEEQMIHKKISNQEFLTQSTADGLRVTINSTIQLSKYLLEECKFKYVLTFKMNQDRLEVNIKNMFIIYLLTNKLFSQFNVYSNFLEWQDKPLVQMTILVQQHFYRFIKCCLCILY